MRTIGKTLLIVVVLAGCSDALEEACRAEGGIPINDGLYCLLPAESSVAPLAQVELPDGLVLVCDEGPSVECRLVDPATGESWPAAPRHAPRWNATAELLPDGRVIVRGGIDEHGVPRDDAEIYDPDLDAWFVA